MYVNWQQTEQIQNDHRISDSIIMTRKRDYPNISWAAIAQEVKNNGINMTSKKCRDRYELYLNPISQIKPEWTKEDDDLLDKLYGKLGAKWALIAKSFSGRSSHEIKNHWAKKKRDSFAKPDVSNEEDEDYDEDEDDQNYDPFKKQQKAIDYIKNYPSRICIVDDYGKDKGGNDIKKVPIVMQGTRTKDIQEYKKNGGLTPQGNVEYHHNTDMDAKYNCTMIALPTSYHNSLKPHYGAACQYRAIKGLGY